MYFHPQRDALHAFVQPCFVFLRALIFSEQTSKAAHIEVPAWEARLAWQASSVHQSGRPFMRSHESAGNNDERLIIGDQADLLLNPTPRLRPGRASPTPA